MVAMKRGWKLIWFPLWIGYDAGRQIWQGDPILPEYVGRWMACEPIGLALMCMAASEAVYRVIEHRPNWVGITFLSLQLIALGPSLLQLMGIQSGITWIDTNLGMLMWSHQLCYTACSIAAGVVWLGLRDQHCRCLAVLCALDAVIVLIGNVRVVVGYTIPITLYITTSFVLACWRPR